jgi:hypothetical protein
MTPKQLKAKIRKLPVWDYDSRGTWGTWYRSQEEHWRGWLDGYDGPGYYNRKDCNRSAEFVYNHINCADMLLWLAEASGVPKARVVEAKAACSVSQNPSAQSAAVRRIIPWEMVEVRLDKRGR